MRTRDLTRPIAIGMWDFSWLERRWPGAGYEDWSVAQALLRTGIHVAADWARHAGKPLVTTECWGVINYKDWPMLDWGWVKELCAYGATEAVATGQWTAMATSTFCGPQFVGMWRDIGWHRRLTDLIHAGRCPVPGILR